MGCSNVSISIDWSWSECDRVASCMCFYTFVILLISSLAQLKMRKDTLPEYVFIKAEIQSHTLSPTLLIGGGQGTKLVVPRLPWLVPCCNLH